tara:strand:+ start:759 stop:998 length:240 start_codon:yes stop_codon:yes gene_type:complete
MHKSIKKILIALIKAYQYFISPLMSPHCRHIPTCSCYAREAIEEHGVFRGIILSLRRIIRCRPGGTQGYDPVPKKDHHE